MQNEMHMKMKNKAREKEQQNIVMHCVFKDLLMFYSEEGVQFVVPCDMDPEMEDAYESFMSGNNS